MKKISWSFLSIIIILTIVVSFTLIGCKTKGTAETTAAETTATETTTAAASVETSAEATTAAATTAAVASGVHKSLLTGEPRVQTIEWAVSDAVDDPSYPQGYMVGKIAEEYMKLHPNVKIKFTYIPYDSFVSQMQLRVAAGNPPALMNHGFATTEFLPSGLLVDLSSYLAQSGWSPEEFYPGIWNITMHDGKQYGIPLTVDVRTLVYNKELFDKAGINPPVTWDDIINNAKKMKDSTGANIIGINGTPKSSFVWEYLTPIVFSFNEEWIVQDNQGLWKGNAESDGILKAIEIAKKLNDSGALIPGWPNNSWVEDPQLFMKEKIASYVTGPWDFGTWDAETKNNNMKFIPSQVPIPSSTPTGVHVSTMGGWSWYAFKSPNNAWDADVCWDIINYYLQPENVAKGWSYSIIPVKNLANELVKKDPRYEPMLKQLESAKFPLPVVSGYWEMLDTIADYSSQAVLGSKPIDQAMKELDGALQKILDKGENALIKEAKGQ